MLLIQNKFHNLSILMPRINKLYLLIIVGPQLQIIKKTCCYAVF